MENILHLIDKNQKIMHLDFTSCGLNEDQVRRLASQVRKSGSLQGMHLCMNPGLNEEVIEEVRQKIKAKPREEKTKMPMYSNKQSTTRYNQQDIMDSQILSQLVSTKANHNLSNKLNMVQLEGKKQRRFIIQRKLGQKVRIPDSAQWHILDDETEEQCWICDQHILTVFLWMKPIAERQQSNFTEEELEYYRESQPQKQTRIIKSEVPLISGSFSNWKGK